MYGMGVLMLQNLSLVVKVCAFACFLLLQGSSVSSISLSLSAGPAFPPTGENTRGNVSHGNAVRSNAPSSASQPNGSVSHSPLALPPHPQMKKGLAPTLHPNAPMSQMPDSDAPPPVTSSRILPAPPPTHPHIRPRDPEHPVMNPEAPVASPPRQSQQKSPSIHPPVPGFTPPNPPQNTVPVNVPVAPVVNAPAPRTAPHNPPPTHLVNPIVPPSIRREQVAQPPQKLPSIHTPALGSISPNSHQKKVPGNLPFSPVLNAPALSTAAHNPPPSPLVKPILPPPLPEPGARSPQKSPSVRPPMLESVPPNPHQNKVPVNIAFGPVVNVPVPRTAAHNPPPSKPVLPPSVLPEPVAPSPSKLLGNIPPVQPILPSEPPSRSSGKHEAPSISTLSPGITPKRAAKPVAAPLNGIAKSPTDAPPSHEGKGDVYTMRPPIAHPKPAPNTGKHSLAFPPSTSNQSMTAPAPLLYAVPPHPPIKQGRDDSPARSPSSTPPEQAKMPIPSPKVAPSRSLPRNPKVPFEPPIQALPPPPPNADCASLVCSEPLTSSPPGPLCICVLPIQVGLRISVPLYTFFPLVSELAAEISVGVFMKQSQVRIMGAIAASQDPEKTVVIIDLVPLGEKFDDTTSNLTFQRIWHKQVDIETSSFGDYEVLYVRYPGLPPSPPSASSDIDAMHNDPYHGNDNNARTIQPLGVDVSKNGYRNGPNKSIVAITVLSASVAVIFCCAVAWILLFKNKDRLSRPDSTSATAIPPLAKSSGVAASMVGSGPSSASLSLGSSIAAFAGSAKMFTSSEIERATDNFSETRLLGEGGFGRVYSGVLDDGTNAAVKILKRDDHHGVREFLAEVEMLSRLHHRNLVKLIGICIDEQTRCLIYELIPNGSVESHLHGVDKETAPLNWAARLKIALGAARGLAYLHEDSSPRVIHRDFKSSNILLEHDFTPKVSDFGLARSALDEENRHISTRVMGTFGYVAPEYAMTGHLLVKSDVYSYGVVLLELLTGRKPVDMSQPPGEENLVSWTRPVLTSKEGLALIVDPYLRPDFPYDSITKVAAIASMCVQPEVSHRPFMGEVVQALKLVCSECDETRELGSRSCSQEDLSIDMDSSTKSEHILHPLNTQSPVCHPDTMLDIERGFSVSEILSSSANDGRPEYDSLRRHSSSGPLRTNNARQLWQKIRRFSRGNVSEHGLFRLMSGSH